MTVIAMTREMGSLGKDVAAGLSENLGLEVIHHELVERDVANRLNLPESDVHRFLEGSPSMLERWKIDKKRLSNYTEQEIYELAAKGNVIIRGWGATQLLKKVSHIIRLRVCAPLGFRARVLQERVGLEGVAAAKREIERNDAAHTRTLRNLMESNWENSLNYDLVLNTSRVPVNIGVQIVMSMIGKKAFEETPQSRQILSDLTLEARVRVVRDKEHGQQIFNAVRSVSGVAAVTNNLYTPTRELFF